MTKKQKQAERILSHGFDLQRIYPESKRTYSPLGLCKKLHRLEASASRITEAMCSYPIDMNEADKKLDRIEIRANDILGPGPPIFINRDPRGYALKISTENAKDLDIHKDWGGYGIICPEF